MKNANTIFANPVFAQAVTALFLARDGAKEGGDMPMALHYEAMANQLVAGMHTAATMDIDFDEAESPLNAIDTLQQIRGCLTRHIESHSTLGQPWPNDATHAVVYRLSTWPVGWEKESTVTFFTSLDMFKAWLAEKQEWAKCEDNYVAYQGYEWDLGPKAMPDYCLNPTIVG